MIRQKTSIERQIDQNLYQFLIPQEGNWNDVLLFAQHIAEHAKKQIDDVLKANEETVKVEEVKK